MHVKEMNRKGLSVSENRGTTPATRRTSVSIGSPAGEGGGTSHRRRRLTTPSEAAVDGWATMGEVAAGLSPATLLAQEGADVSHETVENRNRQDEEDKGLRTKQTT